MEVRGKQVAQAQAVNQASSDNLPQGKRRRWLLPVLLAVVLASAAVAYFWSSAPAGADGSAFSRIFGIFGRGDQAAEDSPPPENEIKTLPLESLVVNLADPGYRRYLRVQLTLEYTDTAVEQEVAQRDYRVMDAIIQVLRSKQVADLQPQNMEGLRQELMEAINAALLQSQITGLYFNQFIIQ